MIAIIDYGMGNLKSVVNACHALGHEVIITAQKKRIQEADHLILPGVGAFPDCMENLAAQGLIDVIKHEVQNNKPLLGICLGMQVLFEQSDEVRPCAGLGLFKGKITKMHDDTVKIPHIGWNRLEYKDSDPMLKGLNHPFVYYVHSYYASGYEESDLIASSNYGSLQIPGAFRKNNLWATQFHPEKSGNDGLTILQNFLETTQ